jgi:hypothetical protein
MIKNKNLLTNILAVVGALLIWFPILAPVLFTLAFAFSEREFRFDYLMPAELFPFALAGSVLLLWAALRVRSRQRMIAWGLGVAVVMLFGGQLLAVVTGLASGEMEPAGWWWALVLASIIVYSLSLIEIGVGGALLLGDLFKGQRPAGGST